MGHKILETPQGTCSLDKVRGDTLHGDKRLSHKGDERSYLPVGQRTPRTRESRPVEDPPKECPDLCRRRPKHGLYSDDWGPRSQTRSAKPRHSTGYVTGAETVRPKSTHTLKRKKTSDHSTRAGGDDNRRLRRRKPWLTKHLHGQKDSTCRRKTSRSQGPRNFYN